MQNIHLISNYLDTDYVVPNDRNNTIIDTYLNKQ